MNDYLKFERMTKRPKFRTAKLSRRYVRDLWSRTISSVIYNYFNILYKLHIIDRFNYRDRSQVIIPTKYHFSNKVIKNAWFALKLEMHFEEVHHIDKAYFFKTTKDGKEKRLLTIKDEDRKEIFAVTVAKECYLLTDGNFLLLNDKSETFKMYERLLPPKCFDEAEKVEYKTTTYNLKPILAMVHKSILGFDRDLTTGVSHAEMLYYYEFAGSQLQKYLDNIRLSDLEVK